MNFDSRMLAVFDPACLSHRLSNAIDWWWYDLEQQFVEMNAGNALFFQLPAAGAFEIRAADANPPRGKYCVHASLHTQSGKIYVGPAEQTTGGGRTPTNRDGLWLDRPPGEWKVSAWIDKRSDRTIRVHLAPRRRPAVNRLSWRFQPIALPIPPTPALSIQKSDAAERSPALFEKKLGLCWPETSPAAWGWTPNCPFAEVNLAFAVAQRAERNEEPALAFLRRAATFFQPGVSISTERTDLEPDRERDDNGAYYTDEYFLEGAGPVKIRGNRHVTQSEEMIGPAPCRKRQSYKLEGLTNGLQLEWIGVSHAAGSSFEPDKAWVILSVAAPVRSLAWTTRLFLKMFAEDEGRIEVALHDPFPDMQFCPTCHGQKRCWSCDGTGAVEHEMFPCPECGKRDSSLAGWCEPCSGWGEI